MSSLISPKGRCAVINILLEVYDSKAHMAVEMLKINEDFTKLWMFGASIFVIGYLERWGLLLSCIWTSLSQQCPDNGANFLYLHLQFNYIINLAGALEQKLMVISDSNVP